MEYAERNPWPPPPSNKLTGSICELWPEPWSSFACNRCKVWYLFRLESTLLLYVNGVEQFLKELPCWPPPQEDVIKSEFYHGGNQFWLRNSACVFFLDNGFSCVIAETKMIYVATVVRFSLCYMQMGAMKPSSVIQWLNFPYCTYDGFKRKLRGLFTNGALCIHSSQYDPPDGLCE